MDDLDDFESMFRREHPRLVGLALALTGDRETARELAQDALTKAYLAWPTLRTYELPGAWLRRIVTNQAIDVHRRRGAERKAVERLPVRDESAAAVDPSGDPVSSPWWQAIRRLPERQRTAIALHYVDGYSIAEIASVMNIRPGTVKATLSQGRSALASVLASSEELR